jgi:aryl-alcohol dehydrogenase-like predicted oxidoreductase
MDYRRLGSLSVPAVGFGAMVLSPGLYGSVGDDLARRALMHAIDAGSFFFDTSDGYGPDAHNERLIGATIAGRRDEVIIATKFGYRVPPHIERHPFEVSYGTLAVNAEPQNIRGYALASLERLRTDYLDLYYPHFPDPLVPIEETVGAMAALVDESCAPPGLQRVGPTVGSRCRGPNDQRRAMRVVVVDPIDPTCVADRHDVGLVLVATGSGFLTGTLNELGPPTFAARCRLAEANLGVTAIFSPLKVLAAELALSPSQLALAWLLHQHPCVVPIPGNRTAAHIAQNAATASISCAESSSGSMVSRRVPPGGRCHARSIRARSS